MPDSLIESIKDRGPDYFQRVERVLSKSQFPREHLVLSFAASVLALRGRELVQQPLQDPISGSLLCWNGEAWSVGNGSMGNENDAACIFRLLLRPSTIDDVEVDSAVHVRQVLSRVVGPFAFLFFDAPGRRVFYGRDPLGRRSLVARTDLKGSISISSVGCGDGSATWKEVDAEGIHELDFTNVTSLSDLSDKSHWRFVAWESLQTV